MSADTPEKQTLVIGTLNPGKIEACALSLEGWSWPSGAGNPYTLERRSVESGVSEQPMGLEETALGAKNRAKSARQLVPDSVAGLGMESGHQGRHRHMNLGFGEVHVAILPV